MFDFTEYQLTEVLIPGDCINLIMEYLYFIDLQEFKRRMSVVNQEYLSSRHVPIYNAPSTTRAPGLFMTRPGLFVLTDNIVFNGVTTFSQEHYKKLCS